MQFSELRMKSISLNPARLLATFATSFSLAAPAFAQTITGTDPVKIFIMAGESNMNGKGTVSPSTTPGTLDFITLPANDPAGKYEFLKSGGSYATRADVGIRGLVFSGAPNPGNLTINYGGLASGLIGPELGFGHVVGDAYENKVLLIEVGVDATTLGGSFCPPSSRLPTDPVPPAVPADKGFYYHEIIRLVNEAKTAMGATPYEIAGLCWHQGCNDRVQPAFSDQHGEFHQ
jgi:alpha-galactosidase